jgi:hypothetical protein
MKNPRCRKLSALLMAFCLCGISFSSALAVDLPNKKEIVTKARQSYYNLRDLGLIGFRCDVIPNLEFAFADMKKTDPAGAAASSKDISVLRIVMSLDAENNVMVTKTELPGGDPQLAEARERVFEGIRQMVTGFYQTTSLFILGNPFPEVTGEYQLEEQAGQYRLSYKEVDADAVIYMDKDLVMNKMDINTPEFTSTISPKFAKNPKGFLLIGYGGVYKATASTDDMKLNVQIAYQDVSGFQLPQKLTVTGILSGTTFTQELAFSGCQVTKK